MSDAELVQFLMDQLQEPEVSARAMFGGHGIYRKGSMFALVYDGRVYMKVSEDEAKTSTRPPFSPRPNQTFPSFREITADEMEDPNTLAVLSESAQRVAAG